MTIKTFIFNPFYENTYIINDDKGDAFVVDPGCYESYEKESVSSYIAEQALHIQAVINTHCHIDHVLGNFFIKEKYGCELRIPEGEKPVLEAITAYAGMYGIDHYAPCRPDGFLRPGALQIGQMSFQVIEAPGHSPGHLTFYNAGENILIGGDVLFRESIGRTDLPGGNHKQLLQSIRENIFTLPNETTVYSGHGSATTIGHEKQFNPFLR